MKIEKIWMTPENSVVVYGAAGEDGRRIELARYDRPELCNYEVGDEFGSPGSGVEKAASESRKLVPQQLFNARQSALKNAALIVAAFGKEEFIYRSVSATTLILAEKFEKWLLR